MSHEKLSRRQAMLRAAGLSLGVGGALCGYGRAKARKDTRSLVTTFVYSALPPRVPLPNAGSACHVFAR